jgi:glycosyltransferase involved in cell wall biosynthesis
MLEPARPSLAVRLRQRLGRVPAVRRWRGRLRRLLGVDGELRALAQKLHAKQDALVIAEAANARLCETLRGLVERYADRRALLPESERAPINVPAFLRRALLQEQAAAASAVGDGWVGALAPEVSVVIGSYNRLELLRKCVESVRAAGIEVGYEIVVVDGGSRDGSLEWLCAQQDIVTILQHNRVEVGGRSQRLRSWGWFMNLGFRAAHGRWILMLSDDCLLVPGSVGAALARARACAAEGRRLGGVAFYFRDWPLEGRYKVQRTLGGMLMVNHGLFSKSALEAVGYAEEELYSFYKCDSDLALKLWTAGYEVVDCAQAFVEHLILPEDLVRLDNNATLQRDREILHKQWRGRYHHEVYSEFFQGPSPQYVAYEDPHGTVAAFDPEVAAHKDAYPSPAAPRPAEGA